MSETQQMNQQQEQTSSPNKRKAPSQARLDKLKKLKENAEKWTSVDLTTSAKTASPKKNYELNMPVTLTDMDTQVSMKKRRNGESLPHVHLKTDGRMKNTPFLLPCLIKRYGQLTGEGNLGKFSNLPNKCRYTVSLEPNMVPEWANDEQKEAFVDQQREFYDKMLETCKEMMTAAFLQEADASWDVCKSGRELEDFVKDANFSCLKIAKDKNDDKYEVINLTRRLTDFQGNPNAPVFWKMNQDGEFDVIEPKYIAKGSFIQCSGTLRAYKVDANMYGVSMDLGRDIIVVSMPKKETPKKKVSNNPSVPFINFAY
jgi:hypothetical protein